MSDKEAAPQEAAGIPSSGVDRLSGFPPGYGVYAYGRMLDTLTLALHILERADLDMVWKNNPM